MSLKPVIVYNAITKKTTRGMREIPEVFAVKPPAAIDMEKLVSKLIEKGILVNRKQIEKDKD